jgi:bisanhydrobacterioruberin hydratase
MLRAWMERLRSGVRRLEWREWAVVGPFGVFCFVYPFALVLLCLDLMPSGMEWMSSLMLAALGLTAGAWLWLNFGLRGAGLGVLIFLLGLGLEYIGAYTGFPFGSYSYSGRLLPVVRGVSVAVGFAWMLVVVGGLFTARRLLKGTQAGNEVAVVCVAGAGLAAGLDLLLEPVAFHVTHYWQWEEAVAGYYGVPWSNFAAWFLAVLVMNGLVITVVGFRPVRWAWVPIALYVMNVVLFAAVNLTHGLWVAAVVGIVLLVGLGVALLL